MSRQGSTKEKIIRLISEGNNTLSSISEKLGLAPSTVSKHLDDLEYAGVISQKENPHIRKWKYYQVTSGALPAGGAMQNGWFVENKNRIIPGTTVVMAAVVIAALYFYIHGGNVQVSAPTAYVPIGITDPPQVPYGTQALYINYSSVSVHVENQDSSNWIPVNASGRLDLMSLINQSQVLGGVSLDQNSSIDMMRFNITSSNIVINNISYNVRLAEKQVVAHVDKRSQVNSSSGVLLDLSPVVTQLYTQNSTEFVMVPSLKAQMVQGYGLGSRMHMMKADEAQIALPEDCKVCSGLDSNLTLSGSQVSIVGGRIAFSATVTDKGNRNVTVMGIAIVQLPNRSRMQLASGPVIVENGNFTVNSSGSQKDMPGPDGHPSFQVIRAYGQQQDGGNMRFRIYEQNGSALSINGSSIATIGNYTEDRPIVIKLKNPVSNISISSVAVKKSLGGNIVTYTGLFFGGVGFVVNANGTLSLPTPDMMDDHGDGIRPGYTLGAGSSFTFRYNGSFVNTVFGPDIGISNETTYRVIVATSDGIASENVTLAQ